KANDFSDFPLAFVVTSEQIWSQLLPQMLPRLPASSVNCSVHRRPAAAFLVLLPGAARTRIVPPDLGGTPFRLTSGGSARVCSPARPEILVGSQQSRRHPSNDLLPLLRADRLGTHFRVCVVLVVEHEYGNQASALILVVDKLKPAV